MPCYTNFYSIPLLSPIKLIEIYIALHTLFFPDYSGLISVENTTQVPLVIISVTPDGARNSVNTTCKPGTVVQPLATCNVDTAFVPG